MMISSMSVGAILLGCMLVTGVSGCATSSSGTAGSEQQLLELKSRYDSGAISKDEYERRRAQIQSGDRLSPATKDAVRGVLTQ